MHNVSGGIDDASRVANELLIAIQPIDGLAAATGFLDKVGGHAARIRAGVLLGKSECVRKDATVKGIEPKRLLAGGADTIDRLCREPRAHTHKRSDADATESGGRLRGDSHGSGMPLSAQLCEELSLRLVTA